VDKPVQLIPLVCLKCTAIIPAEADQMAWACAVCGQGMYLDEQDGLKPLGIFYSMAIKPDTPGHPYWVTDGRVTLTRETYDSSKTGAAIQFWSQPRRFFIPAYRASLETLLSQATTLLLNPPSLQAGSPAHFDAVTLDLRDVKSAAEFIIVAIEANRPDRLKKIDFEVQLSPPVLWILP
jgi:hypothetical protein